MSNFSSTISHRGRREIGRIRPFNESKIPARTKSRKSFVSRSFTQSWEKKKTRGKILQIPFLMLYFPSSSDVILWFSLRNKAWSFRSVIYFSSEQSRLRVVSCPAFSILTFGKVSTLLFSDFQSPNWVLTAVRSNKFPSHARIAWKGRCLGAIEVYRPFFNAIIKPRFELPLGEKVARFPNRERGLCHRFGKSTSHRVW